MGNEPSSGEKRELNNALQTLQTLYETDAGRLKTLVKCISVITRIESRAGLGALYCAHGLDLYAAVHKYLLQEEDDIQHYQDFRGSENPAALWWQEHAWKRIQKKWESLTPCTLMSSNASLYTRPQIISVLSVLMLEFKTCPFVDPTETFNANTSSQRVYHWLMGQFQVQRPSEKKVVGIERVKISELPLARKPSSPLV